MDRTAATFEDILTSLDTTIARLSTPEAKQDADAQAERKYFTAQRTAYKKALKHHADGVRPTYTGRSWLVPSGTRAGVIHRISRVGEILTCDCEAGANETLCWHKILIEVRELADDRLDTFDDGHDSADLCGASLPVGDDDASYADMLAA